MPVDWRPIFDAQTKEFLAYAHNTDCQGVIIIGTGGHFREASCDNCPCRWTRRDARNTWRRAE